MDYTAGSWQADIQCTNHLPVNEHVHNVYVLSWAIVIYNVFDKKKEMEPTTNQITEMDVFPTNQKDLFWE